MKFHYKDQVRVREGFYKGFTGTVEGYTETMSGYCFLYKYTISIDGVYIDDMLESNLEKISTN